VELSGKEPGQEKEIAPEELESFIRKLAKEIVDRSMAAPAIVFLESSKPLSFVGSQTMVFFDPLVSMLGIIKDYDKMMAIMEDREKIEQFIKAIEDLEEEKIQKKKVKPDAKRGY
jgi:hypothetical protein